MKPWALIYALCSIAFAVHGSGTDDPAKAIVAAVLWVVSTVLAGKAQGGSR